MKLDTIILQNFDSLNSSSEFRACITFSLMRDVKIVRTKLESLDEFTELLRRPTTLPVGSVEFLRKSFILANKSIPAPLSYPSCFLSDMVQQPELCRKEDVFQNDVFVKPYATKLFTGFCLNNLNEDNAQDYQTFLNLHSSEPIWVCPILDIDQEWRVYVQDNKIIGYARYDDSESDDANPVEFTQKLLTKSDIEHPYCIDVGRLTNGLWTVIEVNDAWALGLYGRALTPDQYVEYLHNRWLSC